MSRTLLRGLEIGGLRVAIEAPPSLPWCWPPGPLARFAAPAEAPDVYVGVRVGRAAAPRRETVRLDSGRGVFDVARDGSDWVFALRIRSTLQRVARFDASFRMGEVIVDPDSFYARGAYYPLAYPLDELLLLHRLPRDGALLLHAAGVARGRRAMLFTGPSGAGKTTIARLVVARGGATVLSDDRVVVRTAGTGFRVYGTPWHGDAELSAPVCARLDAVHAVRHAPRIAAAPLTGAAAAAAVLGNAFAPTHDRVATERVLELVDRLVARVPVIALGFPKDDRVVAYAWGETAAALGPCAATARA